MIVLKHLVCSQYRFKLGCVESDVVGDPTVHCTAGVRVPKELTKICDLHARAPASGDGAHTAYESPADATSQATTNTNIKWNQRSRELCLSV